LYISYGETDEWAHTGFIVRIWTQLIKPIHGSKRFELCSMTLSIKTKLLLVLPTDHSHGDTVKAEWTSHGNKFEGSSGILRMGT
jgi:hypothetical protein